MDLAAAVLVVAAGLSSGSSMPATMLVEEVARRTDITWQVAEAWPDDGRPVVWLGLDSDLATLPDSLFPDGARPTGSGRSEAYQIVTVAGADGRGPALLIIGHDVRGALYGVGHFLRKARLVPGEAQVTAAIAVTSAPRHSLRGHQLGYRDAANSYDAWDAAQWERYFRELIFFGANAVELIPPLPDSTPSAKFPLPPREMAVKMSALADKYELDLWLWYPAVAGDYADPAVRAGHLEVAEALFRELPRIDHVFVPGGDPGETDPAILLPLLKAKAKILRRHHPDAGMWVSPQGFGPEWMQSFFGALAGPDMDWLTGIVYGPGIRMSLADFRSRVPSRYPVRSYPDITHTFHCQYPVSGWDPAFALTEGREPIASRPREFAAIMELEAADVIGWLTYSDGCNDDVNKAVVSALAWNPDQPLAEILRDYGRVYIGDDFADGVAQGLLALEENWRAPLLANEGVLTTLQQFQQMERAAPPAVRDNWRFQMMLYRAYYDAYVRRRLLAETAAEQAALEALGQAPQRGSEAAMQAAEGILREVREVRPGAAWRARVFELAEELHRSIGMQLSVEKYGASAVNRGANLDMIDFPLNNARWLHAQFVAIRALPDEAERLRRLHAVATWTDPGPGGFYDDPGNVANEPHLVRGPGVAVDPGVIVSPADDFELIKEPEYYREHPHRYAWLSRASTLLPTPLRMRYTGLDPTARYRVRVVYPADRDDFVPRLRLTTDEGLEVHPWLERPIPARPLEFAVPAAATADGSLTLEWRREPTEHGNGRGAQLAEIWLLRED